MSIVDVITRKKLGFELSEDEIMEFVNGAAHGSVPDYQLSAMLMAIWFKGMTDLETTRLTMAMARSGDIMDLSSIPGIKVDKHSTGGVGDTTTLILAPLVAACGVPVAKISGRGLGHTGGTLDKLESIHGMSVSLTREDFFRQINRIGLAVVGQTSTLAPADKTLYALRDVTSTVDSLPLIASSIMSKKLASGADAIVLDVKTGSGAMMRTLDSAIELARIMVQIGEMAGKPVVALVTNMDQPLGTHVGNALEVKDALDVLSGRSGGDLLEVSLALGSQMLVLADRAKTEKEGRKILTETLTSGRGLDKFREMISAQGGDPAVCDDPCRLPQAPVRREVRCTGEGYVKIMNTSALGLAAQAMGAGRILKTDVLDYSVGFVMHARIGMHMQKGDLLCTLHARSEGDAATAERAIRNAVVFSEEPVRVPPLCYAVVTRDGIRRTD